MMPFFKGLIILIITFYICTDGFQCLSKPYTMNNFFEITNEKQNRRFRVFEAGYWKDFQNL